MLLLALLLQIAAAQDVPVVTISPPPVVVKAGESVRIGVYFRNEGTEPLDVVVPSKIDVEIVTPNDRSAAALVRVDDAVVDKTLAPGEIHFVEYRLDLPDQLAGRVVLQFVRIAAAPCVLDVEALVPAEGSGLTGEKLGADEPPDPESAPSKPAPFQFVEGALQRFQALDPVYFLIGTDRPNVRFQFSFAYHFFNPEGPWAAEVPFLSGLFLGYTQTSLWDLEGTSKPFTDTNYRPSVGWQQQQLEWLKIPGIAQTGLEFGFQHESNGNDGDDSRSINTAYVRPILHFGNPEGFAWEVGPKVYAYLPDREDNPDISTYRGYCDLSVSAGWVNGLQAAAIGRLGKGGEYGSVQFDLTYPLRALGDGNLDLYIQLQWFSGYGESLITYDKYTDSLRLGIGFVR